MYSIAHASSWEVWPGHGSFAQVLVSKGLPFPLHSRLLLLHSLVLVRVPPPQNCVHELHLPQLFQWSGEVGFKERLINAINEETIYLLKWLFAANTFTFWIVSSLTAKSFSRKHHQDEEERQLHEHGDHLHLTHYRRIRLANYWLVHYRFSFQIRLFQFNLWHCRMTHCC